MLRRAANVLRCRVAEVETGHQVLGFGGINRDFALVKVGYERAVTESGETVGHAFDLIVQAPPFLDHDDAWSCVIAGGPREVTVAIRAIGPFKSDHLSHNPSIDWHQLTFRYLHPIFRVKPYRAPVPGQFRSALVLYQRFFSQNESPGTIQSCGPRATGRRSSLRQTDRH
jgi:hypothetical protein